MNPFFFTVGNVTYNLASIRWFKRSSEQGMGTICTGVHPQTGDEVLVRVPDDAIVRLMKHMAGLSMLVDITPRS